MPNRISHGSLLLSFGVLGTGCDQVKPLRMPTDTTKEGPGLFTGENGYFDLTEFCSVNQDPVRQNKQVPCSNPQKKQELPKDSHDK